MTEIGSVLAEENHWFNVAHMRLGASWSLGKMVSELLKKQQQQHVYKYKRKEGNWYFLTFFSKTHITGDHMENNPLAVESLAQ